MAVHPAVAITYLLTDSFNSLEQWLLTKLKNYFSISIDAIVTALAFQSVTKLKYGVIVPL